MENTAETPVSEVEKLQEDTRRNIQELISSLNSTFIPANVTECYQLYQLPNGVSKHGTAGKRSELVTNYVSLEIRTPSKRLEIYEYNVRFYPTLEGIQTKKLFLYCGQFNHALGKSWIFKAGNRRQVLYLNFKLDECDLILYGTHPRDDEIEHEMILELVERPSDNQQLTQFCDALFIRLNEILGMLELNQKVYDHHSLFLDPENKLEVWPGLLTYARYYDAGLMIGFDPTVRVTKTTTAYDALQKISQSTDQESEIRKRFASYAVGSRFVTKFDAAVYSIADIDWNQSPMSEVTIGGVTMTYIKYFEKNHGIVIRYMNQPLLVYMVQLPSNEPTDRPKYVFRRIIPELCYPMRLAETHWEKQPIVSYVRSLVKLSAQKMLDKMQSYSRNIKESEDCQVLLKGWNLEMGEFLKSNGRIIDAPKLLFGNGLHEVELNAPLSLANRPFFRTVTLDTWLVFCSTRDSGRVDSLIKVYLSFCKTLGLEVKRPKLLEIDSGSMISKFYTKIKEAVQAMKDVQFLLIVMPAMRYQSDLYCALKKLCLLELKGLPSQFLKSTSLNDHKKLSEQAEAMANQINCKLGGSPWGLQFPLDELIMFVGIDTYHDPRRKKPSVFAIICSLDSACTKFYSRAFIQKSHQEIGDSISPVFSKALAAFHDETGRWPDSIIVFRDGINNKSMEAVKEHELGQMRFATSFVSDCKPKFVFIIVQKRIIEKLFEVQGDEVVCPESGTAMDDVLTRIGFFDFFLVSQLKQQNCIVPVHYVVIANDDDFPPDLIQQLTHISCFVYFNCAEPIRIPGICQYAHRLASLVGTRLMKEPVEDTVHTQLYYL